MKRVAVLLALALTVSAVGCVSNKAYDPVYNLQWDFEEDLVLIDQNNIFVKATCLEYSPFAGLELKVYVEK